MTVSSVCSSIPLGVAGKSLFSNETELLDFAKKFVTERIESLENDVKRCTVVETPEYLGKIGSLDNRCQICEDWIRRRIIWEAKLRLF